MPKLQKKNISHSPNRWAALDYTQKSSPRYYTKYKIAISLIKKTPTFFQ
jgi:hypothetical protein